MSATKPSFLTASSHRTIITHFGLLLLLVDIIHKSFRSNDLLHKLWKCLSFIGNAPGDIRDYAGVEIHLHSIARLDRLCGFRTLNNGQTAIDRIPLENPRKGFRDDAAYSGCFDGDRRVLP